MRGYFQIISALAVVFGLITIGGLNPNEVQVNTYVFTGISTAILIATILAGGKDDD